MLLVFLRSRRDQESWREGKNGRRKRHGGRGKDGRVVSSTSTSRRGRRADASKRAKQLMVTSGMIRKLMSFSTSSHERLALQVIPE
jgi:hypothetical protein